MFEYYTTGVFYGCIQFPEFLPGGGAAAYHPAGGEPPDQHPGGRAGGQAVLPHQQAGAPYPGGASVLPVRPGDPVPVPHVQGPAEGGPGLLRPSLWDRLPQFSGAAAAGAGAGTAAGGVSSADAGAAPGALRLPGKSAGGRGCTGDVHLSGDRPQAGRLPGAVPESGGVRVRKGPPPGGP